MKRISTFIILALLLAACSSASAQNNTTPVATASGSNQTGPQTYTVLVGAHDPSTNADLEAYFPADITIHVGDTVTWNLNSKEIHTVTFLAGQEMPALLLPVPNAPQGAMMFNSQVAYPASPTDGQYDGSTYANSGIMGPDQGQATTYSLTFTKPGTYTYKCVIHGAEDMVGKITVVDTSTQVPTPAKVQAQGQSELQALMAKVPAMEQAAQANIKPPVTNSDGTTTYYVQLGYSQGQVDIESFFPNTLNVHPGDTIIWEFSPQDIAPHTVTFLNGAEEPALVVPQNQPSGPPLLTINPEVGAPQNAGMPLTTQGIYSSGLLDPSSPGPHSYTLKIGNVSGTIPYLCLLHDLSGMKGTITVSASTSY
jgi:plastocyanin